MSEFIKVVSKRASGRLAEIVNIISLSAITVGSGAAAYNGSKAAFAKVTECFQREILEFGWSCRIQGILPAARDTPMMERWGIPHERMMPPSDVAGEVLHCLSRPPTSYGQTSSWCPETSQISPGEIAVRRWRMLPMICCCPG